jgi:simple sugar transport system permease protein
LQIPRELGGTLIAFIILFIAAENIYRPLLEKLYDKIAGRKGKRHGSPV